MKTINSVLEFKRIFWDQRNWLGRVMMLPVWPGALLICSLCIPWDIADFLERITRK